MTGQIRKQRKTPDRGDLRLDTIGWVTTIARASGDAGIAQLVEHNLAKVGVASSNLVSRSKLRNTPGKDSGFSSSGGGKYRGNAGYFRP